MARISFWTLVAETEQGLIDDIDKHYDRSAFERARTLAWTRAQVQLRHLDIEAAEAADFQRLAAPLLYADPRFRAPSEGIIRGAGSQSSLWQHAISGDFPIVLIRIDDVEDMPQIRQLLRAHEYWRTKRLAVDIVIVNERASSYVQDLQGEIETAVRSSQSRLSLGADSGNGNIFTLRADLISITSRELLQSVARIILVARRGPIAEQLARLRKSPSWRTPVRAPDQMKPALKASSALSGLEFFNGLGGFAKNGQEYVTVLNNGMNTPAPWINVIANPGFGFQVSADGSGYTWAENSRENQLTQWTNDPVLDPIGETLYVRDEITGDLWTATACPVRDAGTYVARHGRGYSRFEHLTKDFSLELLQYVALADPIKISRLTIWNFSATPRRISVTAYTEWVLGTSRGATAPFVTTEIDKTTGAMLARNPWSIAYSGRVAFVDLDGRQSHWTGDRTEFLGRRGRSDAPAALMGTAALSGVTGAGIDPCSALQCFVDIGPGQSIEIVSFMGQCTHADEARELILRYRDEDLDAVLQKVTDHWDRVLGAVQVKTPDRAMDIMLNGCLLYQTYACRVWARSAFYQASGAYGFRDQLQDGMALTFAQPDETRRHILRAASRQFVEGDVQHWWLPQTGQGVRTRISDDRVWLAYATATYIATSGDAAILDEPVPFLDGPLLRPEEHDTLFHPMIADESASLFEHCARGIDQALSLVGAHGLPLIGTGDWNDGMSRVGEAGRGESVWLGWLQLRTISLFMPLAKQRDPERADRWRVYADGLRKAIEDNAWDGEWYRRATFDDGTWLGSRASSECTIDSIAQSWAVLSGFADPARASTAMASVDKHLIHRDAGMALLFTPPFDKTEHDPGYIKGYPPGLRENGGQYSHAAMWVIFAYARLGWADKAAELFSLLNPINHGCTPEQVARYKVEPYVVAADVYANTQHFGRGGWTWYTGASGWMYRAGIEAILGLQRAGETLVIDPCIPSTWPGFQAKITIGDAHCDIHVDNANGGTRGIERATVDGRHLEIADGSVRILLAKGEHRVELMLGRNGTMPARPTLDVAIDANAAGTTRAAE